MIETSGKDKYERPILSLRITLTNRCNLNCLYCHHDGMVRSDDEMTPDEIYTICKIAKKLGVKKIRISGGEPLLKKDIVEIVRKIASLNFKDISMTTNGTLLEKYAKDLKDAGLDRVNVSLDTLDRKTYELITKKDYLTEAKNGLTSGTPSNDKVIKQIDGWIKQIDMLLKSYSAVIIGQRWILDYYNKGGGLY